MDFLGTIAIGTSVLIAVILKASANGCTVSDLNSLTNSF